MAKGLTSSYLPLGAVGDAPPHRRGLRGQDVLRRADLLVAPGLASPPRSRRSASTRRTASSTTPPRMGARMREHHERLAAKHPSVGATPEPRACSGSSTSSGRRDPWTPLTPFNGTSDEMKAIGKYLRDHGLYTMIANNSIHTNPPLCINEERAGRTASRSSTRALDIADQAVTAGRWVGRRRADGGRRRRLGAPVVAGVRPSSVPASASCSSSGRPLKFIGGDRWQLRLVPGDRDRRSTTTRR